MCSHPINQVNQSMCEICLFGPNDIGDFCHGIKNKKCPVTALYFGYINKSNPNNCPIKEKTSLDLCKTLL